MALKDFSSSLPIGETVGGIRTAVFWDPHTSISGAGSPITTVTGAPGRGKTFAGLNLAGYSGLQGKPTIILDYKGDMLKLYKIRKDLGVNVSVWDIASKNQEGALDPFLLTENKDEQVSMVMELVNLFCGGLKMSESAPLGAILDDVVTRGEPNMTKVVEAFRGSMNAEVRNIGNTLESIRRKAIAKSCFYNGRGKKALPSILGKGITIATLSSMNLPSSAEEARTSEEGKVGAGILYLLTSYIHKAFNDSAGGAPKTLIIDEAWAIINTIPGRRIINKVALLGRSKNLATILITQSPTHFNGIDGFKSSVGTRFTFGAGEDDVETIVRDNGIPKYFGQLFVNLEAQVCLMTDSNKNYALMTFSEGLPGWGKAFSTNPKEILEETSRKRARAKRVKKKSRINQDVAI